MITPSCETSSTPDLQRISVVIPTFGREEVLLETVKSLLPQANLGELLIVDQTPTHDPPTDKFLTDLANSDRIRWLRLERPSIAHAMNIGLQQCRNSIVLFLDDDIVPDPQLVARHLDAHQAHSDAWAVVGQVLQPGETPGCRRIRPTHLGLTADLEFPFCSDEPAWVSNVMAGNLSVRRAAALAVGGFDENFLGAAYRFETEFARRVQRAGGKIRFDPDASLRHLRSARGGTRVGGSHLTSGSPHHGVGDYYFALREGEGTEGVRYCLRRLLREVRTRFHLTHPWYIPVKLTGEIRAWLLAWHMKRKGPALLPLNPSVEPAAASPMALNRRAGLGTGWTNTGR